jgi:Flp pilus assembly protein TadD
LQRSIPPVLSLSPTMCSIPAAKTTSQQTTAITLTDQSPIAISSDATLMEQAIALMQSGNLEAARQTAQTILQQNQTYASAYSLLGVIALQQKQWQTAQQLLEQAIALDRHSAEDHSHLGMVYFQLGQFELGIAAYQQAIASQPDSLLIRYNLAMAYRKIGRLSDASDQL